jgi:archaellum component FlaG (FlaF/FlaG flagellin family)
MQRLQRDEGNTYVVYSAEGFGRDSLISTIQEVGVFVDGNGIYANCTNSFEVGRIIEE